MKLTIAAVALYAAAAASSSLRNGPPFSKEVGSIYSFFQSQLNASLASLPSPVTPPPTPQSSLFPSQGSCAGCYKWATDTSGGWTAGFFSGLLWKMYNQTGNTYWRDIAIPWTAPLAINENNTGTHDVGFMVFTSFGQQYELTGDPAAKAVTLKTAQSLSTRFAAKVGCIESWGVFPPSNNQVEVIIDNMLNLELLWWAAANGGSSVYYDMASSHADRMIQDAFQPFNPGCVWHLMTYDYTDGTLLNRSSTPQGLGLNTVWSRGQGWATLGFMIAYRYSQQEKYLATAQNAADCFIRLLEASAVSSSDFIPLWDFNATTPQLYGRDTSAAMIAADGMIELAWHLTDPNQKSKYLAAARKMLDSATTIYIEAPAKSPAVLNNGTSSFPGTGYPLIYGDYYFLEAQMKWDATPAEWRDDAAKWALMHYE